MLYYDYETTNSLRDLSTTKEAMKRSAFNLKKNRPIVNKNDVDVL